MKVLLKRACYANKIEKNKTNVKNISLVSMFFFAAYTNPEIAKNNEY